MSLSINNSFRERPVMLVTGGAGYVGLNTCYALMKAGYDVVTVDNYSTGREDSLKHLQVLQVKENLPGKLIRMEKLDISTNKNRLRDLFKETRPDAVIHLAAKIVVGESFAKRTEYYRNNIIGTENVVRAMEIAGVKNCIFASTAAVYGEGRPQNGESFTEIDPLLEVNGSRNYYAVTKIYDEKNL